VNISGSKPEGAGGIKMGASSGPAGANKQQQGGQTRSSNKGLVRLRLSSQHDDATDAGDDDGGNVHESASPRVREVTETNDSCGYDYPKGERWKISL